MTPDTTETITVNEMALAKERKRMMEQLTMADGEDEAVMAAIIKSLPAGSKGIVLGFIQGLKAGTAMPYQAS